MLQKEHVCQARPARRNRQRRCQSFQKFIDQFVSGPMTAEAVNVASMAFKKALIECALRAGSS